MGVVMMGRLAWRNLWRNSRRTAITLSSIALASLLAVMFTGMQDASWKDVIDLAARLGGGHVTVQHPDYQEKPALSRTVLDVNTKLARIREVAHVEHVQARVVGQVMLATAQDSAGVAFMAVDPATEDVTTLSILEAISMGKMFTSSHDRGAVLGDRLAHNLGAGLGDKVVYTLTDKHGEIVTGMVRITGLLKTGASSVDQGLCLLPLDTVRETLGYAPDEATQLAVFLQDHRDAPGVAQALRHAFSDGVAAITWDQSQPDLAAVMAMKRGGTVFMELLILFLAAAGIFNTMLVSVMERLREFGILVAIGLSPARLSALVLWESFWLALVGMACAAVVGAWPYWYLSTTGISLASTMKADNIQVAGIGVSMVLHVGIYPNNLAWICVAVVLATLASGLYPAWRAGRVAPVETIKLV